MANWLKSRSGKYTGYVVIYTLVIIAVLAAVNFLANRYDKSFDATANKQFSLSDQSVKLVKSLKADARLTYFGDTTSWPNAKDLLGQYANLSPKVHTEYIDPVRKPQQAKAAGYRSDSPVLVTVGDKKEGAKALTEEEITGALMRARKTGERNVYFLNAGGEKSIEDAGPAGFAYAKQMVERDNYKAQTLTPKGAAPEAGKALAVGQAAATGNFEIPKDCTVLVVAGPQTEYPSVVVNAIKSYVEGGGRLLVMLDTPVKIGRGQTPAENAELVKLIADWGVTVNKDLVLDLSGVGQIFGLGPEIPLILQYPSHAITSPLTRMPTAFPLSRSLTVNPGGNSSIDKLIETSEDAMAVTSVGAGGEVDTKKGKKEALTLAAAGKLSGQQAGRFIVVGTSEWAENNLIGSRRLANGDLFDNMINWLSSDEDLISIRPKSPTEQTLNLTGNRLSSLFWLSVIIFPLAVVGVGLSAWWKRR